MEIKKTELSVIIATFNSGKTLAKVLAALASQSYPKQKMEILIVDGGSTDQTIQIAKEYGCKIVNNPKTEPVYAKYLGYTKARGRYIIYLDHDEVIENKDSLLLKTSIVKENKKVKAVIGSGYENPKGYPFINNYINEFGDPFSFFIYRLSKDSRFFIRQMEKRYSYIKSNQSFTVFNLKKVVNLPILELCAAGGLVDAEFMKKKFPQTLTNPSLIPHFFYLMNEVGVFIAITKKDALMHYSADNLGKYLNKINWRIKNNIHHNESMGTAGFSGRSRYQSRIAQYKKYLFVPYALSIVFPLLDSLYLVITRRNIGYFLHVLLCCYTACQILYNYGLKLSGFKPKLKSYDQAKTIS